MSGKKITTRNVLHYGHTHVFMERTVRDDAFNIFFLNFRTLTSNDSIADDLFLSCPEKNLTTNNRVKNGCNSKKIRRQNIKSDCCSIYYTIVHVVLMIFVYKQISVCMCLRILRCLILYFVVHTTMLYLLTLIK